MVLSGAINAAVEHPTCSIACCRTPFNPSDPSHAGRSPGPSGSRNSRSRSREERPYELDVRLKGAPGIRGLLMLGAEVCHPPALVGPRCVSVEGTFADHGRGGPCASWRIDPIQPTQWRKIELIHIASSPHRG